MTPLSVLELVPETNKQVKQFSDSIIRDVKNGVVTPQKALSLVRGFLRTLEVIEISLLINK